MPYIPPRRHPARTRFAPSPAKGEEAAHSPPSCYVLIPIYDHDRGPKTSPAQSPPIENNTTGSTTAINLGRKSGGKRKRTEQNGKPAAQAVGFYYSMLLT